MSVQIVCPSCGELAVIHRAPVTECPRCHTPYPDVLRDGVERALLREAHRKPLLLVLGQFGSFFVGALFTLLSLLAPFDIGSFSIEGETVSGPEFLQRGGWLMALIGIVLLAIGVGIWREREWARFLMVAFWFSYVLAGLMEIHGDLVNVISACIGAAIGASVAGWYLYRKPNVRAYYDALSRSTSSVRT